MALTTLRKPAHDPAPAALHELKRLVSGEDDRLRADLAPWGGRLATGWSALDEALGGGLFRGALNEVLLEQEGCGAVEALGSALTGTRADRFSAWVHPSHLPYPPALARQGHTLERWVVVRPRHRDDHLWAIDCVLRSGSCEGLVTFLDDVPDRALRRLQLAAREGGATALLFRPAAMSARASPAPLRLIARPRPATEEVRRRRLHLDVLKCRGRTAPPSVLLEWSSDALDEPALSRPLGGKGDTRRSHSRRYA